MDRPHLKYPVLKRLVPQLFFIVKLVLCASWYPEFTVSKKTRKTTRNGLKLGNKMEALIKFKAGKTEKSS